MVTVVGKDETIRKRVTCRSCSSILEYLPYEVEEQEHTDYGGGRDIVRFVRCPSCREKVPAR